MEGHSRLCEYKVKILSYLLNSNIHMNDAGKISVITVGDSAFPHHP